MHTIFECPNLDDIRGVFLQKLETILPETRNMTNADCLALLMGDDPPLAPSLTDGFLHAVLRDPSPPQGTRRRGPKK